MKVIYIYLDNITSLGVVKKVKSKIKLLSSFEISIEGVFLNRNIQKISVEDNISYAPLVVPQLPLMYNRRYIRNFKNYFEHNNYLKHLYINLDKELSKRKFDLIVFRYPISNKYLYKFTKKYKNKIVFEHNSKELVELRLTDDRIREFNDELKYGSKVLKNAKAIVGVGNEIVQYQIERSGKPSLPHAVISNSIEVGSLNIRRMPDLDSTEYNFLFLTGSPSPWVGIDIVLKSLSEFNDTTKKINLYIVGKKNPQLLDLAYKLNLNHIVYFEGEKSGIELDAYFNKCHIAFGTMAMQRVGLSEHSSLKILEYASRGIPFVIGYNDTNFYQNTEFDPFVLKLPYNNQTFDFNDVIAFTNKVFKITNHSLMMNKLANSYLDTSLKMKEFRNFLLSLK